MQLFYYLFIFVMGCSQQTSIETDRSHYNNINNNDKFHLRQKTITPDYGNMKFNDFPEWEGERYSGIGTKRMKGYKCELCIDQLFQLRNEFWSQQIQTNDIWIDIHKAITMDEFRTNLYLAQSGLKPFDDCVNHLVDEEGEHYYIPNFCINEPYYEKDLNVGMNKAEEEIECILFDVSENHEERIKVMNSVNGRCVKEMFAKNRKINLNEIKLRLLFGGSEIKDDEQLRQHNVDNYYKILVMKIKI